MIEKIILSMLILLTLFGCSQQDVIEIGVTTPLSGSYSFVGNEASKGFDFAVEEINNEGGINGKKVKLIYEDSACDAKQGINSLNKLINVDEVEIVIGGICSSYALPATKIAQDNNILHLTYATHIDIPKQGDMNFRLWPTSSLEAEAIANFAIKDLEMNDFAIMHYDDNPAGISVKDALVNVIEMNNANILATESYSSKEKDFSSQVTKVIETRPEAIYIITSPEQTSMLINKIRELGFEGIILSYGLNMEDENVLSLIDDKKDIFYAFQIKKQETDFWNDYEMKYNESSNIYVAAGYDGMSLIIEGLQKCGEDNNCISNYFTTLKDHQSARGEFSFTEEGEYLGVEYEIKSP